MATYATAIFRLQFPIARRFASLWRTIPSVRARAQETRDALATWWAAHSSGLAQLPRHGDLNAVRAEFLESFVAALLPFDVLDRFKLAGVIASW